MARVHESIGTELADWITGQPLFFVATAPLADDGHVNESPKGLAGSFAVIVVDVDRVADACGYGVPHMDLRGERDQLVSWADGRGAEALAEYRASRNVTSVDGLPGVG
jgi:hypothetical protein